MDKEKICRSHTGKFKTISGIRSKKTVAMVYKLRWNTSSNRTKTNN
jgi:hypothetical protein